MLQKETLFRGLYFQFQFNSSQYCKAYSILHYPNAISQPRVELPLCDGVEMGSRSLGSLIYLMHKCANYGGGGEMGVGRGKAWDM